MTLISRECKRKDSCLDEITEDDCSDIPELERKFEEQEKQL